MAVLPPGRALQPLLATVVETIFSSPLLPLLFVLLYVWIPEGCSEFMAGDRFPRLVFHWMFWSGVVYLGGWLHTLLRHGLIFLWSSALVSDASLLVMELLGWSAGDVSGHDWTSASVSPSSAVSSSTALSSSPCLPEVIRSFPLFLGFRQLHTGVSFLLEAVRRHQTSLCGLPPMIDTTAAGADSPPSLPRDAFLQIAGTGLPSVLQGQLQEFRSEAESEFGGFSHFHPEFGLLFLIGVGIGLLEVQRCMRRHLLLRYRPFRWRDVGWSVGRLLFLWGVFVSSQTQGWDHVWRGMGLDPPQRSLVSPARPFHFIVSDFDVSVISSLWFFFWSSDHGHMCMGWMDAWG